MTNRKSIAFTIYSLGFGGAERVVSSLANEMTKYYKVYIITLDKCESSYELDTKVTLLSCDTVITDNHNVFKAVKNNIRIITKLSGFIKNLNIDILIGFTTTTNILSIIAAKIHSKPIIISERNNPIFDRPNKYWITIRNVIYRFTDLLVVQTSANKTIYSKIIKSNKISVIINPIATSLVSKADNKKENTKNKTILTVGRLDTNKSQDLLIKAFSNIQNKEDWSLEIVGEGRKMNDYKSLVNRLGIYNKTTFFGNVTNIYKYYNKADVFVFTSRSEGFPNALVEALYFGLPCISTNCPFGPSELVENGVNGILIDVDDQSMLEIQLQKLMNDETLRHNLSANAIEKRELFDIDTITNIWMKHINQLLSE